MSSAPFQLPDWLTWENVGAALNSAFTTSLVGALAGAFFGAMAAQRIAVRTKRVDQLLDQVRMANTAIMASFAYCNHLLAFKRQHVRPLYESFSAQKRDLAEFHRMRDAGNIPKEQPFQFNADLRTVQMPLLPVAAIERLLFERLSVSGRPLALAIQLAGVSASLGDMTERRLLLIEGFKQLPQQGVVAMYFGLPFGGRVSTEFADVLEAMHRLTDDGIFFSKLLCEDLVQLGNKSLDEYKKLSKQSSEKVAELDFTIARDGGLLPDEAEYQDWLRGFKKARPD